MKIIAEINHPPTDKAIIEFNRLLNKFIDEDYEKIVGKLNKRIKKPLKMKIE